MDKYKHYYDGLSDRYFLRQDFFLRLINSKKYGIVRHIGGISLLAFCLFVDKKWDKYETIFDYLDWIFHLVLNIVLFYVNMDILVPKTIKAPPAPKARWNHSIRPEEV